LGAFIILSCKSPVPLLPRYINRQSLSSKRNHVKSQ
jgi:hypothetical protein